MVYAIVGATLGVIFAGANRWARKGLVAVVGGIIVSVLIGEVLPSVIDTALEGIESPVAILYQMIPFGLRLALIWVAIATIVEKLRNHMEFG